MNPADPDTNNRTPIGFWLLSAALIVYVAACTGFRDQVWGADAWEHHRAVLALTQDLWHPGNPTFAIDTPSVRYSPYAVALAVLCRSAHVDPYTALSLAAVVNTALLCGGVGLLLRAFGEAASAGAALLVMVSLYGGAPGYANSYALADLPWHQVNPSAFSFGLTLLSWALFRQLLTGSRGGWVAWPLIAAMLSCAMLDHAMTGAFGVLGLAVLAATGPPGRRLRAAIGLALVVLVIAGAALAWPWYSFPAALRWHHDRDYWFNPGILTLMLTQWCAPAILCGLFTLPLRNRPLVRWCLAGGVASLAVGLAAWLIRSPALARFPLPGLIYFHIAIGVLVHQTGLLRPRTWPGRIRNAASSAMEAAAPAILQSALAVLIAYFLIPQLWSVATLPHLARPYLARLLHRPERGQSARPELAALLRDVGPRDVIIADPQTSWILPSVRGRIVSAIHYELFVPDQPQRADDLATFFSTDDEAQRDRILAKYDVRWIVLNVALLDPSLRASFLREAAVVNRTPHFVLMRADEWVIVGGRKRHYAGAPPAAPVISFVRAGTEHRPGTDVFP